MSTVIAGGKDILRQSTKGRPKATMSVLIVLFNIIIVVSGSAVRQEKINKGPWIQFSLSVMSDSLTKACQASLSITNSWSLLKLMFTELVRPSSHLILCRPFSSCPQSFQASRSFPTSQLFASGGQSIGVSASTSVLPINNQD